MDKSVKSIIESILEEQLNGNVSGVGRIQTISGKEYFLKSGIESPAYQCEANGLMELAKAHSLRVANVISVGVNYILTEYIREGRPSPAFYEGFGRRFAQMHRFQGESFGFYENNFIGANPQLNIPYEDEKTDWAAFYFNKRILYQYKLAERNGNITSTLRSGLAKLESKIDTILKNSKEPPTLLHGDLWSGNYLCDTNGIAVLIDPAVYYGHREADLAMTKVFGGFSPLFYEAYMEEYPLAEGWEYRENIYKLYHILNHLNIFGRSYLSEAEYLFSQI